MCNTGYSYFFGEADAVAEVRGAGADCVRDEVAHCWGGWVGVEGELEGEAGLGWLLL